MHRLRLMLTLACLGASALACPDCPPPDAPGQDAAGPADATGDGSAVDDGGAHDAGDRDRGVADRAPGDSASGDRATADARFDECPQLFARCTGHASREACIETAQGRRLVHESCEDGAGCVGGQCLVGQCSDECQLFASGCALHRIATGETVVADASASLAHRARLYHAWLVRDLLPAGGVANLRYADTSLAQRVAVDGVGDSAIWTGTYLMAEALRLMTTGSVDAADSVARLVRTLHLWFNVSGHPGYLARYAESIDHPPAVAHQYRCDSSVRDHCDWLYQGERYNWLGVTSRDQYQGVMTGLALAYDASGDESVRALIREDVVEVAEELMIERTVPVWLVVDGRGFSLDLTSRYLILAPSEYTDGKVLVSVETSDPEGSSDLQGAREFVPDMADLLRQLPLLSWLPDIPRSSSTIMLASFFLTALRVTEGVAEYAARRQAIADFYALHADAWYDVAELFTYTERCGHAYYGSNITWTPAYNYARLEGDPVRGLKVRNELIRDTMWPNYQTHKNAFFAFIAAAHLDPAPSDIVAIGTAQTALYKTPPHVDRYLDLTAAFPSDPDCTEENNNPTAPYDQALDVNLRPPEDFYWQRHPWNLRGGGNGTQVYPGVDYLIAYWMGRYHGFIADDQPGVCARRD
ncbi:MAG: hypothetical protein JXR83_16925 [Deltaproteobacteria bacterium]|nr:hypothetical protein [Deltaproteobacteria bacterium]